jgi:arsenate reductase (thioredoxin)
MSQAPRVHHVLFVCTGNSARSIIAEGLLNHLGRGRFVAHSAGSHPKGRVHPLALHTLAGAGIPTDGFRSKSWDEFGASGAPQLDFVFTVCDQAGGEQCPFWPGQPITAHWGMSDPAAVEGPEDVQKQAFLDTLVTMRHRIELMLMLALPMASLERQSLHRKIADIGTA